MLMIGDTMYMNAGGRSMKMPMPKNAVGQFRNEQAIADLEKGSKVEALGPALLGAVPTRKYRFTSSSDKQQSSSLAWVSVASGLVLQVETSGKNAGRPFAMRVAYSDYNSPAIRITAPK